MDSPNSGVIIGCNEQADILDKALMRAGRFDGRYMWIFPK